LASVLSSHHFHGEWNYTVSPKAPAMERYLPDGALAQDPDGAAIDCAIELEIGGLPDDGAALTIAPPGAGPVHTYGPLSGRCGGGP
jgi:hypothetical protein